jgi:hypothetical protein
MIVSDLQNFINMLYLYLQKKNIYKRNIRVLNFLQKNYCIFFVKLLHN